MLGVGVFGLKLLSLFLFSIGLSIFPLEISDFSVSGDFHGCFSDILSATRVFTYQ